MLLLSGVFKPSGPEREQDHRRSMANLSVFHRPSLILLICLPFVEAHSQLPEFRIRPCFVTKTAQVIMLNGWTKGWTADECVCGCASMWLSGIHYLYGKHFLLQLYCSYSTTELRIHQSVCRGQL